MNRRQLEHVIGTAAAITEDDDIVVMGSAAIVAGREKDLEFAAGAFRARMLESHELESRLARLAIDDRLREAVAARIRRAAP